MKPAFTILLPVHRPPALLPYAIESVLAQERGDFELFIICDGAPEATAQYAHDIAGRDARIRVFVHPKGERNGEVHRHEALQEAQGLYVCQIADDDLWLPDHLVEMAELLRESDFGNVLQIGVKPDGRFQIYAGDLAARPVRERMMKGNWNFFGPTVAGYRMSAYRRLPAGWSPAPATLPSDLYMWRKFLAAPGMAFRTRVAFTALNFRAPARKEWPIERRREEMQDWARRIQDAAVRQRIRQELLHQLLRAEIGRQYAETLHKKSG